MEVEVRGNIEKALTIFRKRVQQDGTLKLFTERSCGYLKPSVKSKLKHRRALSRINRTEKRREERRKTANH